MEKGLALFQRGSGPITRIILPADPSFDDLFAATLAGHMLAGQKLPRGCTSLARYAALGRQGRIPSGLPFEESLEGIYLALRLMAGDLAEPQSAKRFVACWNRMAHRLLQAAEADLDPTATPLFNEEPAFADAREFLSKDRNLYLQDVARGESWTVRLPGGTKREAGLFLRNPKSRLFRYWCSSDNAQAEKSHAFLAVQGGNGQWLFCSDPRWNGSLLPLVDALQQAEHAHPTASVSASSWRFDSDCDTVPGHAATVTSIMSPFLGTKLPDTAILALVRARFDARKQWRRAPLVGLGAIGVIAAIAVMFFAGLFSGATRDPRDASKSAMVAQSEDPVPIEGRGIQRSDKVLLPGQIRKGNLHLLSIGISKYRDPGFNLVFAHLDAQKIAEAFQNQQGKVFGEIHTTVLTNEQATREAILEALSQLKNNVTQHDLTIVTLSGHGANLEEQNHFYFVPYDFNEKKKATTGVYWDDFKRFLIGMPSRVFLVMDTCHSGTITLGMRSGSNAQEQLDQQVKRALPRTDQTIIVMAACLSGSTALENADWGHGVLTLALLEGINGRRHYGKKTQTPLPITNQTGEVSLKDLDYYVTKRVHELAAGAQAIVTNHTGDVALDRIPIAWVKPRND
jgi:hypothetical protein